MQDTKEKLLRASIELFSKNNYDTVSFTDIARRANVQKSAVWYHYSSKKALYNAVIREVYTKLNFGYSILDSSPGYRDGMRHFIKTFSNTWLGNPEYAMLTSRAILNHQDKSRVISKKFWEPFVGGLERFIAEGQATGEFLDVFSPRLYAMQIGGAVLNVSYSIEFHRHLTGTKKSRKGIIEEFQQQLQQTIERSLFAPE